MLDGDPQAITDFLRDFDEVVKFRTEPNLINLTSLGMVLEPDYHWKTFESIEGDAAYYPHEEIEEGGVLLYTQGTGRYCAQNMDQLEEVERWFTVNFEEYRNDDITLDLYEEIV